MLRSVKELHGYPILASDGEIGKVEQARLGLLEKSFYMLKMPKRYALIAAGKESNGQSGGQHICDRERLGT